MVGAVLGCVLHAIEVLPATVDNGFCKSQRSVLIGVTFYCLSFMFWRVRKLVFLDFLCISQEDEGLKGEAMISMGAILKSSASNACVVGSELGAETWLFLGWAMGR